MDNYMEVKFKAVSENEKFARLCVAGFCLPLGPSVDEINDIKTAVSEAVTNSVVHAYPKGDGEISMRVESNDKTIKVTICDNGVGIKDIQKAREPFYTTRADDERSGMGFTIMESFMDEMSVEKNDDKGLRVTLKKTLTGSAQSREIC